MKKQIVNPYLPFNVCEPDGEPHVFGDRVYVYGSHDEEGGNRFCKLNYEFYSAPVDDLTSWSSRGISYDKTNDPDYSEPGRFPDMYAPDVVKGNDGRYYLYYALSGGMYYGKLKSFTDHIHVAVSEKPDGPFRYHGCVRNADGTPYDRNITFDPGVINDDGVIRLYYGWAIDPYVKELNNAFMQKLQKPIFRIMAKVMIGKTKKQLKSEPLGINGAFTVTLADDMLTVTSEPKMVAPSRTDAIGTPWEKHGFFEASSIRKIGDTYYFIYSSEAQHELCYATSKYPDKDFTYGGVIISNGDIGYQGRKEKDKLAIIGNNHGSIEKINGKWYVFYHRQTHKTSYSRQGCAEEIQILPDGSIPQVEMTSCGLNGGPLVAKGCYNATIACNLTNGKMPHTERARRRKDIPYITNTGEERYITNIQNGTLVGYKYFAFTGETTLVLNVKCKGTGIFDVYTDEELMGSIEFHDCNVWTSKELSFKTEGRRALYFRFKGSGMAELLEFSFKSCRR